MSDVGPSGSVVTIGDSHGLAGWRGENACEVILTR